MTLVTEDLSLPDGSAPARDTKVVVRLTDLDGRHVSEAYVDETTRVGRTIITPDVVDGQWAIEDLPGNAGITPAGTVWERTITGDRINTTTRMLVPVDGSFRVDEVLAAPLDPLPAAAPSTERDVVLVDTELGPFTGSLGFSAVPVPGVVVEVPDVDRPCYVEAQTVLRIDPDDLPANGALVAAAIGPPSVDQLLVDQLLAFLPVLVPPIGDSAGPNGRGFLDAAGWAALRVEPRSPQEVQLYLVAHDNTPLGAFHIPTAVTVGVFAAPYVRTRMSVIEV